MDQLSHLTSREAATGRLVSWRKIGKHAACDECLALAYETPGHSIPITVARTIRSVGATSLYLCWIHAEAWKTRDRDE